MMVEYVRDYEVIERNIEEKREIKLLGELYRDRYSLVCYSSIALCAYLPEQRNLHSDHKSQLFYPFFAEFH